ncbi:MAG: cytochrome ubiquinol oxidase subunit I [Sandaracinaceae bacterium]
MELDLVGLSRAQFALTIMVHYLFPPLSIGLGALMVVHEGLYLWTKDRDWEALARFWTKLFAVNFAVGVATGIVMEFQFGTNWSAYSRYVGDVFGSALASEGIFAFFLESGFLAILVFGWDRVSSRVHFLSTVMVFLGSCFSAVWIVIANSWMHTPAGHHLVRTASGGVRAEILDFWAVVFNPSAPHRLTHVLLGSLIVGAFFVMSICAFYLLRRRHERLARKSFTLALVLGAVSSVAMLLSGHEQATMVAEHQPAKLAAFEGHFRSGPADLYVLGWPDREAEEVRYGVAVPGMLSVLLHGDPGADVTGLDAIPDEDEPPVLVPFVSYHVMVALGTAFVGLTVLGLALLPGGRLWRQRWLLRIFVLAVVGPYVANELGWVAAEVGRQPWIVYGLLRTTEGVSPSVSPGEVLISISLFSLIYLALCVLWLVVMNEKIQHGPSAPEALGDRAEPGGLLAAAAHRGVPGADGLADTEERRQSRGPAPAGGE